MRYFYSASPFLPLGVTSNSVILPHGDGRDLAVLAVARPARGRRSVLRPALGCHGGERGHRGLRAAAPLHEHGHQDLGVGVQWGLGGTMSTN